MSCSLENKKREQLKIQSYHSFFCFHRCLEEYEKSQSDNVDWSALEQDNVICPVCQRDNLKLNSGSLTCSQCKFVVHTSLSLDEIKKSLEICIEKHSENCTNQAQFAIVPELNQLYLICHICKDMQSVI